MRSTVESSRAVTVAGRSVSVSSADSPSKVPGSATTSPSPARFPPQPERALQDDIGAVGGLAGREQHLAGLHRVAFGADGEDAQCAGAEATQNRHPLKERDVILDGHDNPRSRHQFVAAGFGDQDGRRGRIFLDLLP